MDKLKSYKPGTVAEMWRKKHENDLKYSVSSDFSEFCVEYQLKCWSCNHKFLISVSAANLHCTIFLCPYCDTPNEIE